MFKKILSRQETPNSVLKDMQGKVKGGKQKRRHESSGVFRPGYGTELCSRSFFIPKEAHQCEWQCAMSRQQLVSRLAAAAEGQTVAGLSRCRGHGSGCVRSIRFCQAGMHSVPGRGLVR